MNLSRPAFDRAVGEPTLPTRAMLVTLVVGAGLAFSTAFACATPFAALAAVGALRMRRGDAVAAVTLAWLVNQADGFLFMHYPHTWDSLGWGGAIGLAAVAATLAAATIATTSMRTLPTACGAFVAAFCVYEGVLFAATAILPSSAAAFSPTVVGRLLAINAGAFALLIASIAFLEVVGSALPAKSRKSAASSARINRDGQAIS